MAMSKAVLREELITIIVNAAARGTGNGTVGPVEAAQILDFLVSDDSAPEWEACREPGRSILRKVIRIYRSLP